MYDIIIGLPVNLQANTIINCINTHVTFVN